jgi:hypothetical protein
MLALKYNSTGVIICMPRAFDGPDKATSAALSVACPIRRRNLTKRQTPMIVDARLTILLDVMVRSRSVMPCVDTRPNIRDVIGRMT